MEEQRKEIDQRILTGVEQYYSEKVIANGCTSLGVDWNSKESQYLRFSQLCKVLPTNGSLRVLDHGCGYGELVNFLDQKFAEQELHYLGVDLSPEMVSRATERFSDRENVRFSPDLPSNINTEFCIASGLFNVKPDGVGGGEWHEYMLATLRKLNEVSPKGFAFNALTKYSDAEHMKDYLHYSDPCLFFDICKKEFSKEVALLHDYGLYEFTMIIRK